MPRAPGGTQRPPDFEVSDYWYEGPAFYFGNAAAIIGPGGVVRRPKSVEWLDFELEMAAIVGGDGEIAGFTILNDWSGRDMQMREGTIGLGVHKSKDFGTSLGPCLVTPDELPYTNGRLRVTGRVEVNGEVVTEVSSELQHYSFEEMRATAARNTRLRRRRRAGKRHARRRLHRRDGTAGRAALAAAGGQREPDRRRPRRVAEHDRAVGLLERENGDHSCAALNGS